MSFQKHSDVSSYAAVLRESYFCLDLRLSLSIVFSTSAMFGTIGNPIGAPAAAQPPPPPGGPPVAPAVAPPVAPPVAGPPGFQIAVVDKPVWTTPVGGRQLLVVALGVRAPHSGYWKEAMDGDAVKWRLWDLRSAMVKDPAAHVGFRENGLVENTATIVFGQTTFPNIVSSVVETIIDGELDRVCVYCNKGCRRFTIHNPSCMCNQDLFLYCTM